MSKVSRGTVSKVLAPALARGCYVVGIGASAGGVEALSLLVAGLPLQLGAIYVVAQHMSSRHRSSMVEILARRTSLPVCEIADGQSPLCDTIHIIPPGAHIVFRAGRFHRLELSPGVSPKPSINRLFQSMAEQFGKNAVGVILSGTGSDGAAGLAEIKAAGGVALIQTPATAGYDGMPSAAIDACVADYILAPGAMGAVLQGLAALAGTGSGAALNASAAPHPVVAQRGQLASGVPRAVLPVGDGRLSGRIRSRQSAPALLLDAEGRCLHTAAGLLPFFLASAGKNFRAVVHSPQEGDGEAVFLLEFEAADAVGESGAAATTDETPDALVLIRDELDAARQYIGVLLAKLSVLTHEMQSLQEALQTGNEELQAGNEELQTTNEELLAANEELLHVNHDSLQKSIELAAINNDFESVYNTIDFPVLVFDAELRLKRSNDMARRLYGLLPYSIGQGVDQLALPDHLAQIENILSDSLATQRKNVSRIGCAERSYQVFVTPVLQSCGAAQSIVLVVVDDTDLVQSQARIQESQQQFLAFMNNSASVVIIKDVAGRYVFVNKQFEAVFSVAAGTAIGRVDARFLPPAVATVLRNLDLDAMGALAPVEALNKFDFDGRIVWLESIHFPVFDASGVLSGMCTQASDVTAKHRVEAELVEAIENVSERLRAEQKLEALVAQRTVELTQALDAARVADVAKDEFLANVSHELRTPLNAVIGLSGIARSLSTDDRQSAYLGKVINAGKILSSLIDDLLDLSKIVAGRMEFEMLTFGLRPLMSSCLALVTYQAEEKGIELFIDVADDVPDVLLSAPLRIRQIMLNLLSNAIKFTGSGRVGICIERLAQEGNRVSLMIAVTDTGIGLSEETMGQLFQPFQQADATISRKYGGTGLGLALCKRIAEMLAGEIGVRSRLGEGTRFEVRLWMEIGDAADLPVDEAADRSDTPTRYLGVRVLVVDDQPYNCEIVETLLRGVGIGVDVAHNGAEAVDRLSQAGAGYYDLVLMDVQMPVMDGLTATRIVRGWPGFADLPVIALTAHTMMHEREKTLAAGMNDHLGKPFDSAALYRLLVKWVVAAKQADALPLRRPAATIADGRSLRIDGVNVEAGLALMSGNAERYHYWLHDFATRAPADMARMMQAVEAGDTGSAVDVAHALKGRSGLLGMDALHEMIGRLEAALERGAEAGSLLPEVSAALDALCQRVAEAMTGIEVVAPALDD